MQIAKLRFFISLVVSQKIDRTEDNANITALPNLETKLVAANSLIPIERPRIDDLFRNKPSNWDEEVDGKWEGRKAGSYKWFEIQDNIAYWQEFETSKIVYPDIYEHQSFAWDCSGAYGANTCYFMPTDQRWLTGFLNSSLVEWVYGHPWRSDRHAGAGRERLPGDTRVQAGQQRERHQPGASSTLIG